MDEILSVKNQLIKNLKKLHQKKYRDREGKYLLEGFHLVEEALLHQAKVEVILVERRTYDSHFEWFAKFDVKIVLVSEEVLKSVSELPTPQGVLAVVCKKEEYPAQITGKWLLLDQVQDPGNVGTLIRTADAAGFQGVFLGLGSADIYSTKVLRSMQGSNYHLPILSGELSHFIAQLKENDYAVYGTELSKEAVTYTSVPIQAKTAIILGNEGQGVQTEILRLTKQNLYIPIYGKAESLNVGVAGGILMYHFVSADSLKK
ncbi:MAG: TrmH family RNA methyltransferase [Enterococcus lemanii]